MDELRSEKSLKKKMREKLDILYFRAHANITRKNTVKYSEKCGNVIPRSAVLQGAFDSTPFHARFCGADNNLQRLERSLFRYRFAKV